MGLSASPEASRDASGWQRELRAGLRLALSLPSLSDHYPLPGSKKYQEAVRYLQTGPGEPDWVLLFTWLFLHNLGRLVRQDDFEVGDHQLDQRVDVWPCLTGYCPRDGHTSGTGP